ncbi:MAG: DUF945 family protein [Leucothrix sp.]
MKKILIALLLLVIAAVAAAPYLIGSQIEKITNQLVDKTNQQLASAVKSNPQIQGGSLKIDEYKKGYLDSQATGVFTLDIADIGETKQFKIPFNTKTTHGPYLGDAGFGLAKIVSRPDLSELDLPDAITADTFLLESIIDFSQAMTQTLTVAPIKHADENGKTVDFAGATINSKSHVKNRLTFTADVDVKQLVLGNKDEPPAFTLKPFQMDISGKGDEAALAGTYQLDSSVIEAVGGESVNISLQKMAMVGSYKQATGADVMLGDAELSLSDLVVTNPEDLPTPIKVPNLKFSSKLEQASNNDLSIAAKYEGTLDQSLMTLMNSPVNVKTAVLDIQFKAIPIESVSEYQAMMENLMTQADNPDAGEKMQGKVLELIQSLANNAMSTQLKVNAQADEGELVADIDTGFKPGVNFDAAQMMQLMMAPDPSTILPLMVGRGNVSLSKGVTDKAGLTPMIQIMAADFVTLKDDKFVAELQIDEGQLLINGNPLPLAPQ